jgi:hypothetical protein
MYIDPGVSGITLERPALGKLCCIERTTKRYPTNTQSAAQGRGSVPPPPCKSDAHAPRRLLRIARPPLRCAFAYPTPAPSMPKVSSPPTRCPQYVILARMSKNNESEFEKLARLIKEEGRTDVHDQINGVHVEIGGLRKKMHEGFAAINRRLDQIIQTQLDEHATRIKKLETAVFSK